jgi:hypothetical protein
MGEIFGKANGWEDISVVDYPDGNTWWEQLTTGAGQH